MTSMNRSHALAWPSYVVAALLVLFPLVDSLLTVFPLRPGDVNWRFGAAGLFSRALMTPLLGLLLVFAVALLLDQRRILRVVAVVSGLLSLVLLGTLALFALDTLQMRAQVRPEIVPSFDVAALTAMAKYGAVIVALLMLAVPGWRNSQREKHRTRGGEAGQADLLLGGRPTRPAQDVSREATERRARSVTQADPMDDPLPRRDGIPGG